MGEDGGERMAFLIREQISGRRKELRRPEVGKNLNIFANEPITLSRLADSVM